MGRDGFKTASAPDALSRITLEMTSRLDLDQVLAAITRGLVEDFGIALARALSRPQGQPRLLPC